MIPKNSTPIKNEILMNIFAKRKLSYPEMSIAFYIIRWSWGFNGIRRRQDWTRKLIKRQIANDINMKESQLNKVINRMITESKLIVKDNCYQFNEHYEEWKLNGELSFKATKNLTESEVKLNGELSKLNGELSKLNGELSLTDLKPLQDKTLPDRKETLKETNKETFKEKGDIFNNTLNEFIKMRNKNKKKMTDYAIRLLINELDKLSDNEDIQIAILNQSIMNSWQGVFPLKDKPKMTQEEALARMEVSENDKIKF